MFIFLCYSRYNSRHAHSFFSSQFTNSYGILWQSINPLKTTHPTGSPLRKWYCLGTVSRCWRLRKFALLFATESNRWILVFTLCFIIEYERSILFNKIRLCIPMNINFLPMYWDGEQWVWFQVNLDSGDYAIDLLLLY